MPSVPRVLIALQPSMYAEVLALWLARGRPAFEVAIAAPERAEEQVRTFGPHLLVRNDTDGPEPGVLARVLFRVEVVYSNGMDARIHLLGGRVEEAEDMLRRGCSGWRTRRRI
jgi:hypothetical protein